MTELTQDQLEQLSDRLCKHVDTYLDAKFNQHRAIVQQTVREEFMQLVGTITATNVRQALEQQIRGILRVSIEIKE